MPNRRNNDERFAWYMEQSTVDFIAEIMDKGERERSTACFGYFVYQTFKGKTYEILFDSDAFIRGCRCFDDGITYL